MEDSETGEILIPELHTEISPVIIDQAENLVQILEDELWNTFPKVDSLESVSKTTLDMILGMNWKPSLCIIGADGIPFNKECWKCT